MHSAVEEATLQWPIELDPGPDPRSLEGWLCIPQQGLIVWLSS